MPYSQGPYYAPSSLPSPATTRVTGSRQIDFGSGRYKYDADGNPVGMNPTAQRVLLAISFGAGPMPKVIDDRALEERRANIELALARMVTEGSIRDVVVVIEQVGPARVQEHVDFFNTSIADKDSVVTLP